MGSAKIQGRAKKILPSSARKVLGGLIGCALAAFVSAQKQGGKIQHAWIFFPWPFSDDNTMKPFKHISLRSSQTWHDTSEGFSHHVLRKWYYPEIPIQTLRDTMCCMHTWDPNRSIPDRQAIKSRITRGVPEWSGCLFSSGGWSNALFCLTLKCLPKMAITVLDT